MLIITWHHKITVYQLLLFLIMKKIINLCFISISSLALILCSCEKKPTLPILTSTTISNISGATAESGGDITSDGGAPIIARGVCWSTGAQPTVNNSKTSDESGAGKFSSTLTNLSEGTTYHVRAYATNSAGTGYGEDLSFSTSAKPILTTIAITALTSSSAISGGNITSDGQESITERGVCWSTTLNPTVNDSKTTDGIGTGTYSSNISGLTDGTTYHIRAYATNVIGTTYGEDLTFTTLAKPTLNTIEISAVTITTAVSGGNISSDGGTSVIARGLCWSTSPNPTIADNITSNGTGSGNFTVNLAGLEANSTYYLRAYATNSVGTGYGDELVFKTYALADIENNYYHVVTIGTQTWMQENLTTTRFNNGDIIATTDPVTKDISAEVAPTYQWAPEGNESLVAVYGRLYSWFAVADARKICPAGWHVPTDDEWTLLTDYLTDNGYGYNGSGDDISKSMASVTGWTTMPGTSDISNDPTNNSSGFTAVPAGIRMGGNTFSNIGYFCDWWSSTEYVDNLVWHRQLYYSENTISRGPASKNHAAFSVRCIKN